MLLDSRIGIGPMSKNTVDACIQLSDAGKPCMIIASRRQIDSKELGGGYVESWTTQEFARYVRGRTSSGRLALCRDHGGPWQHPAERDFSPDEAMASCLGSFQQDILCGFDLLHIDTSAEGKGLAEEAIAIDRLVKLYQQCHATAQSQGRTIEFEIGFEAQGIDTDHPRKFAEKLEAVLERLSRLGLPRPLFVVAQTGTKVEETQNVGAIMFASVAVQCANEGMSAVCREKGVGLKAHNADYLPADTIRRLQHSGIAALNVAPEFGVVETRAICDVLRDFGLHRELAEFKNLSIGSKLWVKWMKEDTKATDDDRAEIAGHYIFGTEHFRKIKDKLKALCAAKSFDLDAHIQAMISRHITRYFDNFA